MKRQAFTLIELLVTISIIGLLIGLLLPAIQSARAAGQRSACQNTLKQLGLAIHNFESAHRRFPPQELVPGGKVPGASPSWLVDMLPYVEQEIIYRDIIGSQVDRSIVSLPNRAYWTPVKAFICPADNRLDIPHEFLGKLAAFGSYLGIYGNVRPNALRITHGVFARRPGISVTAITDGTSNTVAVVERPPPGNFQAGWWFAASPYWGESGPNSQIVINGEPQVVLNDGCTTSTPFGPGRLDNPCDRLRVWSLHPSGANFMFADGSVRFFGYGFAKILPDAATIAGGETIELP